MADEFKAESVVTEATDMKGAAKIYYTLAVEKIKDVCGTVVYDETVFSVYGRCHIYFY